MRQYVRKSNTLVTAPYTLTLQEQRVLLCCIAQIPKDVQVTDEVFYTVTIADIIRLSGIASNAAYAELKKAAEGLKRKEVRISYGPLGEDLDEVLVTNWAQTIKLSKKGGTIGIRFPKDLLPYLTELNKQYTYYALADAMKMSSIYSIRLYEFIRSWRKAGKADLSLVELRDMFELHNKYPEYYEVKRRVLDPAIKEINEVSPMFIMMEPIKDGKTVTGLLFDIQTKEPTQGELPGLETPAAALETTKPRPVTEAELSRLAFPGESLEDALRRLNVKLKPKRNQ